MKVWTFTNGCETGFADINIGDKVAVYRCGGFTGRSRWGEEGKLTKVTAQHLIFTTNSGAIIKTKVDNLFDVRGKAAKAGYIVKIGELPENTFKEEVGYWNREKGCFEKK